MLTNGWSNNIVSALISWFVPKYRTRTDKVTGALGDLSRDDIKEISQEIKNNGFYIFDSKLNATTVQELIQFSHSIDAKILTLKDGAIKYSNEKHKFDPKNILSPRYQFDSPDLLNNKTIQNLSFDKTFLALATEYLNTKPILDIVTMWWSAPFSKEYSDKAAQKFHFDMDRFKFLKFFIYLTDVTTENGPHCYVRSSHKRLPVHMRQERRIEDHEIANFFNKEDILELTGQSGAIMAVDTRGLHKGKPLETGNRLIVQFQFSNLLFGAPFEKLGDVDFDAEGRRETVLKNKRTYRLISDSKEKE